MVIRTKKTDPFAYLLDSRRSDLPFPPRTFLAYYYSPPDPHFSSFHRIPSHSYPYCTHRSTNHLHIPQLHRLSRLHIHLSPLPSLSLRSCCMLRSLLMGFTWIIRTLYEADWCDPTDGQNVILPSTRCEYILCVVLQLFAKAPDRVLVFASLIHIWTCLCAATTHFALSLYPQKISINPP